MSVRRVRFKPAATVEPCPKCGNRRDFTIVSRQVAEDGCEVWAICRCGFEHGADDRLEDVWGGVDDENVVAAIGCWNDATRAARGKGAACRT